MAACRSGSRRVESAPTLFHRSFVDGTTDSSGAPASRRGGEAAFPRREPGDAIRVSCSGDDLGKAQATSV